MLHNHIMSLSLECQQFVSERFENKSGHSVLHVVSKAETESVRCLECGRRVYVQDHYSGILKDIPLYAGETLVLEVKVHRYQCAECGQTFTEEIPFRHPGTRVTERAAEWIRKFLAKDFTISAVSELTGIHWDTIRRIHQEIMEHALEEHEKDMRSIGYKPKRLAVDEFSIHRGHTYATTVMDLDTGDVIWVGKGRSVEDFRKFFEEYDLSLLSEAEAVAMDMNASYNRLVAEYLPHAAIVYDRYHMQAQFGKDVLGSVRLEEAAKHKKIADGYKDLLADMDDGEDKKALKSKMKAERHRYSSIKGSRWTLLTNSSNLSQDKSDALQKILMDHEKLAVCYAMKEELCRLFDLRSKEAAEEGWRSWFAAAKQSGISQLVKFAELKEKRIDGLVSHAEHPISTGKLEGFNNRIKVLKRIGYGYRDDRYFFTLIRYHSISDIYDFHNFP